MVDLGAGTKATIETWVGHSFSNQDVLTEALTHPSATRRGKNAPRNNQRLEFLGDRVLGLAVAHLLIARFPHEEEGPLSRRHAHLVRRETLAEIAGEFGLGDMLTFARSEEAGNGRVNPSILADALEALIGALYLDGGLEPAERFVRARWEPHINTMGRPPRDAKTALQEWAQARGLGLPAYTLLETSGPAHAPEFEIEVTLADFPPMTASASSKRQAEQMAAKALLDA
ncbi:MAG: ribonuclease III, partial [Geminicoccaceae bacterium]